MRKQSNKLQAVIATIMMLIGLSANAHDFEVDGIYYTITSSEDKTVAVSYQDNINDGYNPSYDYTGDIVIPKQVTYNDIEYSVTSIGYAAFLNCFDLTSVEIPNSVTSIGRGAFYQCSGISSIEIPNSVTSIGELAFAGCVNLASINIPNFITEIGHSTFSLCKNVESIIIPDSVINIADGAFSGCSSLTSVTIPNSVTSIGYYAFSMCDNLKNVYITDIEAYCNIKFYDFLYSFYTYPNPVYYAENLYLNGELIEDLVIPEGIEKISNYLFYNLDHIKSVTIPNSVTSIGSSAFSDCDGLTSVTIGDSVTSIGNSAFKYCTGLKSIEIPNSVTSIGSSAFEYCTGLTSVTIGDSVTSIGNSAFSSCTGLTSVTIGDSVTSIGNSAFSYCDGLTSVTIGDSVTSIGNSAFKYCTGLKSIEIPNSVTSIGNKAFEKCSRLIILGMGQSLETIGKDAFLDCNNIKIIKCKSKNAPMIGNQEQFSDKVYQNANLFVPPGSEDNYKNAYAWSKFKNVIGKDFSVKVTLIEVTPTEVEAEEGSEVQLSVVVLPEEATNKEVAWSSSNESVATVDNNGLVSIHKEGEATITATTTDGSNLSATCVIKAFSGIVEVESLTFYVKVVGDDIVVCDAELGSQVAVYGIDGLLVGAKEVVDMQTIIAAPIKGIYLVRVGETMVKVLVK